jgi:3-deoxy-D-manno-octulosonate 8-phosphate phosphatase (KDO 8-P phosphatase)
VARLRAEELGVARVLQCARDKRRALGALAGELGLARDEVLYVGDDLNDLPAFEAAGLCVAVADAAPEVRARADWVTAAPGGRGAVREVIEGVLRAQGRWEEGMARFRERLEREQDASGGGARRG